MKSEREVKREYARLLNQVATEDFYKVGPHQSRVNCYTCESCGAITKTKDIDSGVTPFIISCPKCGEAAQSSFYRPHPSTDGIPVTMEWYRPSLEETLKLRKKEGLLDHVLQGGLLERELKPERQNNQ